MEIGQERLRGGLVSSSGRVRALGLLGVAWFLVWEVSSSGGVWGVGF